MKGVIKTTLVAYYVTPIKQFISFKTILLYYKKINFYQNRRIKTHPENLQKKNKKKQTGTEIFVGNICRLFLSARLTVKKQSEFQCWKSSTTDARKQCDQLKPKLCDQLKPKLWYGHLLHATLRFMRFLYSLLFLLQVTYNAFYATGFLF